MSKDTELFLVFFGFGDGGYSILCSSLKEAEEVINNCHENGEYDADEASVFLIDVAKRYDTKAIYKLEKWSS